MDEFASERRRKRRQSVLQMLRVLLAHLESFPADFQPERDDKIRWNAAAPPDHNTRTLQYIFAQHYRQLPPEVLSAFLFLSFVVANECALATEDYPKLQGHYLQKPRATGAHDALCPYMWVMRRFAGSDPDIRARKRYVDRHFTKYQPYENMIYTFLGPAAFEYYSMGSREGKAKVQPHEVSTS